MKQKKTLLFAITFMSLFSECNTGSRNTVENPTAEHKYSLTFADAKNFLSSWSTDNTLVIHLMSDPANLHPASFINTAAAFIMQLTQGHLLTADLQKPQLTTGIVKSMPQISSDHLRYTYEILDEAKWDDGSPVTADDVIFTLKALKCPLVNRPLFGSYVTNLKTIAADSSNPRKFTLLMKKAYIADESFLTDIPILSRKFFDPQNVLSHFSTEQFDDSTFKADQQKDLMNWSAEFNDGKYGNDLTKFSGCGPYRVTQWDRGQTVILQRKPNHWTQHIASPNIYLNSFPEKIIFKIVKDENAIELEFKSQTMDVTNYIPTKVLMDLQTDSDFNKNYNAEFMESFSINNIVFNMRPDGIQHKKIFDDLDVRRAFALVIPVDEIVKVVTMGKAVRWPCIVSPLLPDFNADLPLVNLDPESAKKMLDKAGWKDSDGDGIRDKVIDGEKVPLQVDLLMLEQGNPSHDIANMITESAAKAGIKIVPRFLESGVLTQKLRTHDFDLAFVNWSLGSQQQDYTQLWHTHSWLSASGTNYGGFGDATSDALIDSIKYTLNDSLRYAMSKRLQKIIYDAQPYVFMYSADRKLIIHKRWGNQMMSAETPCMIVNNLKLLAPPSSSMIFSGN